MAMEMDHSFTVPVPPERAWDVLLDVEKIAPCMPGATVDESGGEGTTASMHTTMNVTGRPAQFGRGVMVEVGSKLVEQFAQHLRQLIAEDGAAGGNAAATATDEADGGTSAGQTAAEAEAGPAGTSQDGPGSTQPSPVLPAAATTPTPTAQPPAAS